MVKSTLAEISETLILLILGLNVGVKNLVLPAAKAVLVFKTVIGPKLALAGTVTVKLTVLAALTVALVAPKKTILLAAVVLKPVPVIVTVAPTAPLAGVNELIVGCAVILIKPNNKMHSNKCFKIAGIFCIKSSHK